MRTNRVLGGAVVMIVVLATVSAVLASRRDAPVLARGGPVAAVRAYLSAVVAGRTDEAARWLAPESPCGPQDFAFALPPAGEGGPEVHVDLVGSTVAASTATVDVEVRIGGGGFDPFGGGGFTERRTFTLRDVDGAWRLTGLPWPLETCSTGG